MSGGILAMLVMVLTYEIVNAIELLLQNISNKYVIMAINGFLLSFTISPKSLANAGREIYDYLMVEDLENARYKVGWIVGRDTENLSPQEVSRAAIETVAENTVDGIISPLFFFLKVALTYNFFLQSTFCPSSLTASCLFIISSFVGNLSKLRIFPNFSLPDFVLVVFII